MTIDYKYNEGDLLREITDYVNSTYGEHYAQNKYQATEFIIDGGHGVGFTVGNIMKYAQRYGHKGTPEDWRKDMMKVIHYAIIALYVHDKEHNRQIELDYKFDYQDETITSLINSSTINLDRLQTVGSPILDTFYNSMGESPLTSLTIDSINITGDKTKKSKKKD